MRLSLIFTITEYSSKYEFLCLKFIAEKRLLCTHHRGFLSGHAIIAVEEPPWISCTHQIRSPPIGSAKMSSSESHWYAAGLSKRRIFWLITVWFMYQHFHNLYPTKKLTFGDKPVFSLPTYPHHLPSHLTDWSWSILHKHSPRLPLNRGI